MKLEVGDSVRVIANSTMAVRADHTYFEKGDLAVVNDVNINGNPNLIRINKHNIGNIMKISDVKKVNTY